MARLHRPKAGFWIRAWVIILFPVTRVVDMIYARVGYLGRS